MIFLTDSYSDTGNELLCSGCLILFVISHLELCINNYSSFKLLLVNGVFYDFLGCSDDLKIFCFFLL